MKFTTTDIVIAVAVGAFVGAVATRRKMVQDYNKLVRDYNNVVARDGIKARVFQEVLPALPDSFTFSEQTQVDIAAFQLFDRNDL